MDTNSTYATAYLPKIFFDNLSKDIFNKPSNLTSNQVAVPWLVRYYRLFEALSDWMSDRKKQPLHPIQLIKAWSNSKEISDGPFNADTGRLISSDSLAFLKILDKSITNDDIKLAYSAISKVLKRWDEWYLDSVGNRLTDAISQVAPVAPTYARILTGTKYFKYKDDASKYFTFFDSPIHGPIYEISYMEDRDKSFEQERIQHVSIDKVPVQVSPSATQVPGTNVIEGKISMDTLLKFRDAKRKGEDVVIRSLMGNPNPLQKAEEIQEIKDQTAITSEVSKTPVLDWLVGATDREDQKTAEATDATIPATPSE